MMLHKSALAAIAFLASTTFSLAAEFGDLAGTYTGKTAKGGDIVIVVPKSGTPSYNFRGSSVRVAGATLSGKTIRMKVGPEGLGDVVLNVSGKGASYKYTDGQGNTTASLSKK